MEVKKINCFMPVLIVSYVFLSSLVSLLMVVAINQLGIHIPGWVSYVISEAVIIVIGLIYIAVMGISIKRDMQYHIIAFKDVIVSIRSIKQASEYEFFNKCWYNCHKYNLYHKWIC